MTEIWIGPNRRALALGLVLPVLLVAGGMASSILGYQAGRSFWYAAPGLLLITMGVLVVGVLLRMLSQPRVARAADHLLLFLGAVEPISLPIDVVECFFIGQAGGMIPDAEGREAEVRTVIIRLAESAKDWHHRDVKAAFGQWCEGYITIRGTWCEPITQDLMARLNRRLVEVHRHRKQMHSETLP